MVKWIIAQWNALPVGLRKWLRGAEVAVVSGVITTFIGVPMTDLHNKESIAKLAAGVGAAAYAALRLYIAQSPVQNVIAQVDQSSEKTTETAAGVRTKETATKSTTVTGPSTAGLDG